jgi:hypothetical protein
VLTIAADFNALIDETRVRLTTRSSVASLATAGFVPGDSVWFSDGELDWSTYRDLLLSEDHQQETQYAE